MVGGDEEKRREKPCHGLAERDLPQYETQIMVGNSNVLVLRIPPPDDESFLFLFVL